MEGNSEFFLCMYVERNQKAPAFRSSGFSAGDTSLPGGRGAIEFPGGAGIDS